MKKPFYIFKQNNSGGQWEPPAAYLIVEADDFNQAKQYASNHITFCGESGLYAEYDNCGCCPCCGHRWNAEYHNNPHSREEALEAIKSYKGKLEVICMGSTTAALIKPDGSLLVGDNEEKLQKIVNYLVPEKVTNA